MILYFSINVNTLSLVYLGVCSLFVFRLASRPERNGREYPKNKKNGEQITCPPRVILPHFWVLVNRFLNIGKRMAYFLHFGHNF